MKHILEIKFFLNFFFKRVFLFLAFVLIFISLNISIQAMASSFLEEPSLCFQKKNFPCAVRALQTAELFQRKIFLKKGSDLIFYSAHSARLLDGTVFLESEKQFQIDFGLIQIKFSGKLWVQKKNSMDPFILVRNIKGRAMITAQSVADFNVEIPSGFQNWYQGINDNNQISEGVIKPIEFELFLQSWNQLVRKTKSEALADIHSFQEIWKSAIEQSAALYQDVIERKLATELIEEERRKKQAQAEKEEKDALRKMYRSKTFGEF